MEELSAGSRGLSEGLRDIVQAADGDGSDVSEGLRDIVQAADGDGSAVLEGLRDIVQAATDAPEVSESLRALTRPPDPSRIRGTQEFFEREQREKVLTGLEDNVLLGVTRRYGLPAGVDPPRRPPRLINVTIRVDDTSLNYARGRAVTEGTSVSALVNRLLEEYSGVARPPGQEISRRIPMFRERRVKPIPSIGDL